MVCVARQKDGSDMKSCGFALFFLPAKMVQHEVHDLLADVCLSSARRTLNQ